MQEEVTVTPDRVQIRRAGSYYEFSGGGPYVLRNGIVYVKNKPSVVVGNNKLVTRTLDTRKISRVFLRGEFTVELSADNSGKGSISADDALLRILQIKAVGNQLHIELPSSVIGKPKLPTRIRLAISRLEYLEASRATTVQARIAGERLSVVAREYARLRLSGTTDMLSIKAARASAVLAGDLRCNRAEVDAGEYSRVRVAPQASLVAWATRASQILYATRPEVQAHADTYSRVKRTQ